MFVVKCLVFSFIIGATLSVAAGRRHHNNHNAQHHADDRNSVISTKELRRISKELFDKLPDGTLPYLEINYQGRRDFKDVKDEAAEPLINVPKEMFEVSPTVQLLYKLYDNYNLNALHAEVMTPEKDLEENDFIDSLLGTNMMIYTMDFLANKGFFPKKLDDYKKVLKKIWFQPYSRSNHTKELGSSGFEHVFLVEQKRGGHITGLHNWIFFAIEEYDNKANYLGYIAKEKLANKAALLKFYVSYLEKTKLSSMFIGTPPEFEFALYTLCFYARPNKSCKILLDDVKVTIQTWVQYSDNEALIGSAFPKIY